MKANNTILFCFRPKIVTDPKNVTNRELAFSSLVAILGGLVESYSINPKRYEPTNLIYYYNENGRNNYTQVVEVTNKLLEKASTKVTPVS